MTINRQNQLEEMCSSLRSAQQQHNLTNFVMSSEEQAAASDVAELFRNLNHTGASDSSNHNIVLEICATLGEIHTASPTATTSAYLTRALVTYVYPALLVFGLFGNLVSFLAMARIYSRRKNYLKFSLSLATLALADLLVLLIGCLREYLDDVLGLSIRASSSLSCKLVFFACYLFSCFSAYLHGYIAIERWMAISDPIKSKSRSNFHSNKLALGLIFLLCVLFNLPLLYFPELQAAIQLDSTSKLGVRTVDDCQV
jgi:hypothetical protein